MSVSIKNCGFREPETLIFAIQSGCSFIGLVHAPSSPRHLEFSQGAALRSVIPLSVRAVAVMVNPDDATLYQINNAWQPDILQLHAVYDLPRLQAIKALYNRPIIVAIPVANQTDILRAATYRDIADYVLFDVKSDSAHGGTGASFNWEYLHNVDIPMPWFLAGGLTSTNVSQAIALTGARYVDVSSGIESSKGIKSKELIAAFNHAVLHGVNE